MRVTIATFVGAATVAVKRDADDYRGGVDEGAECQLARASMLIIS